MPLIKGYNNRNKAAESASSPSHKATVENVKENQAGASVVSYITLAEVGTDVVDSIADLVITAAAHAARIGDIIVSNADTASQKEATVVAVATNTITIAEDIGLSGTDSFLILRYVRPRVSADGRMLVDLDGATITAGELEVHLQSINDDVTIGDQAGNVIALVDENSVKKVPVTENIEVRGYATHDHSGAAITTSTYTQLVSATSHKITKLRIFDGSGEVLLLATGAAASEVPLAYIFPGGIDELEVNIPAGTRIAVIAIGANTSDGRLAMNLIG